MIVVRRPSVPAENDHDFKEAITKAYESTDLVWDTLQAITKHIQEDNETLTFKIGVMPVELRYNWKDVHLFKTDDTAEGFKAEYQQLVQGINFWVEPLPARCYYDGESCECADFHADIGLDETNGISMNELAAMERANEKEQNIKSSE